MLILIAEHHGWQNVIMYACKKFWVWEDHPYLHPYVLPPLHVSRGVEWEIKKQRRWKRWKVYSSSEKMRNALVATKVKMSGNEKFHQTWRNTYKIFPLIKHVTRKFHVVVMQNNNGEMYKKVCCISKVVFLLIMTYGFFCCSHCWSPFSVTWFYFLFEYKYIKESFAFS